MDMQCRLVTPTPIQYLGTGPGGQQIYIKRDDLLGFSFGGNKCRIAEVLLQDMKGKKGCDFFVSYGSRKSNLNRVVGTLCKAENPVSGDHSPGGRRKGRYLQFPDLRTDGDPERVLRQVPCKRDGGTDACRSGEKRDIILIISMEIPAERE